MARPTTDPKSRVIKVRVNEEIANILSESGNVSEEVRKYIIMGIENHGVIQKSPKSDGFVPQKRNGVFPGISEDVVKDLSQMAKLSGTDLNGLIKALQDGLNNGGLEYANGEIRGVSGNGGLDMRDFYDACEEKKKNPQEVLNRFTRMVWNT